MSKTHPIILVIGDGKTRRDLYTWASDYDWHIISSDEMMDALAQYMFYVPDIILIDDAADAVLADDVYFHLRSIDAQPVLVLSDLPGRWSIPAGASIQILPTCSDERAIVRAITQLVQGDLTEPTH